MAEPLIKLEPNGTAPVISYNVPERTAQTGRNYIVLELPGEAFNKVTKFSPGDQHLELQPRPTPARPLGPVAPPFMPTHNLVTDRGVLSVVNPDDFAATALRVLPSGTVVLDPAEIDIMRNAGFQPTLQRASNGDRQLRYVARDDPNRPVALMLSHSPDGGPGEGIDITVAISSPQEGAVITGPQGNVGVTIEGTAETNKGSINAVNVTIGSGTAQAATLSASGQKQVTWSHQVFVNASGDLKITAEAIHSRAQVGRPKRSRHVTIAFNPSSQGTDVTPPVLSITSPLSGDALQAGNIEVAGTASDPDSGVANVNVSLDRGAAIQATPKAANDWSTWRARIPTLVSPGEHLLIATATDRAGNKNDSGITFNVQESVPVTRVTRLMLIEVYQLTPFLGNYGPGKAIQTGTLLPGERVGASIKTYTKDSTEQKAASSVLDSAEVAAQQDFSDSIESEQTNKEGIEESQKYSVNAEAQAAWGWGTAKVSGGISGGSNAAREDFRKNLVKATRNHVQKASSKREVQVNTSYQVSHEERQETSLEREFQNVNVSRVLNFVFRQMNQEYVTLLHLVDVRIGYFRDNYVNNAPAPVWREATLSQLDSLIDDVITEGYRADVTDSILHQLRNIYDYQDVGHNIVEHAVGADATGNPVAGTERLRLKLPANTTYTDAQTGFTASVPGIIMAVDTQVLRTEGVIVEALLGQGEALDDYSKGLQEQAVRAKLLENERITAEIVRLKLAIDIVSRNDAQMASLFEKVFPCCPEQLISMVPVISSPSYNASGSSDKRPATGGGGDILPS
jgi:hypothetical protein